VSELRLEVRDQADGTVRIGGVFQMTPPSIGEDYWTYRVRLGGKQAVVGFPKFSTIGVGFAVEEDWNSNLPYTCDAGEIFDHIAHNKGDDSIADDDVREAIRMVQEAATAGVQAARIAEFRTVMAEAHGARAVSS
jgi:hypothetical protein